MKTGRLQAAEGRVKKWLLIEREPILHAIAERRKAHIGVRLKILDRLTIQPTLRQTNKPMTSQRTHACGG
jgi:hypothetical protein